MSDLQTRSRAVPEHRTGTVLAFTVIGIAVGAMLVGLIVSGGRPTPPPAGIPDAGGLTEWALPVIRVIAQCGAVVTVGLLLAAAVLLPSRTDVLSTGAVRAARTASWVALVWGAAALLESVLVLSDVLAYSLLRTLSPAVLTTYLPSLPAASAWAVTGALALLASLAARECERPAGAWLAFLVGVGAVAPPALSGHAASAGNHDLAMSSLLVHLVAIVLWVGGLIALVWYARTDGRFLAIAAQRFSPLALTCYVAVGISGVANAFLRIPSWSDLWTSGYGRLVVVKVVAFAGLGVLGWWHRRTTLPQLQARQPGAFRRFAGVEALVMLGVIGIAVALSRTPPPADVVEVPPTQARELLGFGVPAHPSLLRYVTEVRFDILIALTLLAMAVLYLGAARRLHRRGDRWSIGRTASWLTGVAILAFANLAGLSTYGHITFSAHMTQHMLMSMLAPIFLVLGAPISLALRALPPAGRDQPAGPREWLLAVLHSRVMRGLTHPVVALVLFVSAPYMIYFSGLFQYAMYHHWAHLAMHIHFVLVGYLFYETLVGVDPLPYRASFPVRLIVLFLSLPFHAFFAIAMMSSSQVIAAQWYQALGNPYHLDLLADQRIGAAFAWGFGEVPLIVALIALLVQWSRDDDRRARRSDRQADRDGDAELTAYNEMLATRSRRPDQEP